MNHRRSARIPEYDYTQPGAYFVTLVCYQRKFLFGRVTNGIMALNAAGRIIKEEIEATPVIRPYVEINDYVIMPNHVHMIIVLRDHLSSVGATRRVAPTDVERRAGPKPGSIGAIVGQIKSRASKRINLLPNTSGCRVWQRNFHEHVIRDDLEWQALHDYISTNPMNWANDQE